jgi:hypothetical protein
MVALESHSRPRDYLLLTILDDIQKAACAILRWDELLGGEDTRPTDGEGNTS